MIPAERWPDRRPRTPSGSSCCPTTSLPGGAGLLFNDLTVYFADWRGRLAAGEVCWCTAPRVVSALSTRLAPAPGRPGSSRWSALRSPAEIARTAGATDVVWPTDSGCCRRTLPGGGKGVDIVMDPVGGDRFTDSLRSLAGRAAAGGRLHRWGDPDREGEPPAAQQMDVSRRRLGGLDAAASRIAAGAVGGSSGTTDVGTAGAAAAGCLPACPRPPPPSHRWRTGPPWQGGGTGPLDAVRLTRAG